MFDSKSIGRFGLLISALAVGVTGVGSTYADVIQFQAGVHPDASYTHAAVGIRSDQPNSNLGSEGTAIIGADSSRDFRAIFSFDLGALPDQAQITNVTLTLQGAQGDSASTVTDLAIELRSLAFSFNENETTWTKRDADNDWASPGGDLGATPLASSVVDADAFNANSAVTFDSTAAFVSAAQAAYDNGMSLQFIAKVQAPADMTERGLVFIRSDDSSIIASRPLLTVEYNPIPEPATLGTLSILGITVLVRRPSHCR